MTRLSVAAAIMLSLAIGAAWAQDTQPAAPSTAPSTSAPAATTSASDKAAISKSCTDQANAKGLHGKARKKFRSECKRKGGKVE